VRSTIDAAVEGTPMNKTDNEAHNLIEEMTRNNFQWSTERAQPRRFRGNLEVDTFTLLFAKVDAMTKRLDQMIVNAGNSSAPSLCEICGSIEHICLHYQIGSPFS